MGKGSKYNPKYFLTIGYPDFSKEAIENVRNSGVTLITHTVLAEMLILKKESVISEEKILEIFKSKKYWKNLRRFDLFK